MSIHLDRLNFHRMPEAAVRCTLTLNSAATSAEMSREAAIRALGELWLAVSPSKEEMKSTINALVVAGFAGAHGGTYEPEAAR